ncbi:MAG: hypothetical protein ACPLTR_01935 [Thermacetogeniaceae bacterium]
MEPRFWEEALDLVLDEMRKTMIQRHKKYGPKNILELGLKGVLDRAASDKIARLKTYYEPLFVRQWLQDHGVPQDIIDLYVPTPKNFADESVEDAHIDAANYLGPISLMLRRGWWTLPMKDDVR